MPQESSQAANYLKWSTFQKDLVEYVRLELAGEKADEEYPDIALLIDTSPECEEAYYIVYRNQVLSMDLKDLEMISQRLRQTNISFVSQPATDWYVVAMKWGRAWLERGTDHWRQLEIVLTNVSTNQDPAPTLTGVMKKSGTPQAPTEEGSLHLAPDDAPFELVIAMHRNDTKSLLDVVVTIEIEGAFGDFSGTCVSLTGKDINRQEVTDSFGEVIFADLPREHLSSMNLVVKLPE